MDGSSVSGVPNLRHPYTIRSRHAKFQIDAQPARYAQTLSIQLIRLTNGVSIRSAVARAVMCCGLSWFRLADEWHSPFSSSVLATGAAIVRIHYRVF